MSDLQETMKQRGNAFGSYEVGVDARADILKILIDQYVEINGKEMPVKQLVWLQDIVNKLCRTSSNPAHLDSIHDLVGYSSLTETMLKKQYKEGN